MNNNKNISLAIIIFTTLGLTACDSDDKSEVDRGAIEVDRGAIEPINAMACFNPQLWVPGEAKFTQKTNNFSYNDDGKPIKSTSYTNDITYNYTNGKYDNKNVLIETFNQKIDLGNGIINSKNRYFYSVNETQGKVEKLYSEGFVNDKLASKDIYQPGSPMADFSLEKGKQHVLKYTEDDGVDNEGDITSTKIKNTIKSTFTGMDVITVNDIKYNVCVFNSILEYDNNNNNNNNNNTSTYESTEYVAKDTGVIVRIKGKYLISGTPQSGWEIDTTAYSRNGVDLL